MYFGKLSNIRYGNRNSSGDQDSLEYIRNLGRLLDSDVPLFNNLDDIQKYLNGKNDDMFHNVEKRMQSVKIRSECLVNKY